MTRDNIFMHDAVPTWSGFLYQGRIAVYLAIRKINELRANGEEPEIEKYELEMEKCEDIALVYIDGKGRGYHSIHQVKNVTGTAIDIYKNPLIQLMLEKGFCKKNNYGMPAAYLHISHDVDKCGKNINELVLEYSKKWKDDILKFYNALQSAHGGFVGNEENLQHLSVLLNNNQNTIGINRKEYKNKYKELLKMVNQELHAIGDNKTIDENLIKDMLGKFIEYLEERLYITDMCLDVEIYEYETGKSYCSGKGVFNDIVEQIKIYKRKEKRFTDDQLKYLADIMINDIESNILRRHSCMQENKDAYHTINLSEFKKTLDRDLERYEENANILALHRIYNDSLEEYCYFCKRANIDGCNAGTCRLQHTDYRKVSLENEDFKKFCYNLNPECAKQITDRECLHYLLTSDGMMETVFPIIERVEDEKLIEREDKTHIKVNNKDKVAYVTAISGIDRFRIVHNIEKAMRDNRDLIETIFEADQLITTRLSAGYDVWDSSCIEVKPQDVDETYKDNENKSIYVSKKPEFIKVNEIINDKE